MSAGSVTGVEVTSGENSQRGERRRSRRSTSSVMLLILVVFSLAVAACSSGSETADHSGDDAANDAGAGNGSESGTETVTAAEAGGSRSEIRPPVTLGVTDWTGARLTVALAELLIERRLGYPVDVVVIADNRQMLDDLAANELDAALEVWPSDFLSESQARLAADDVTRLGELGVVAKSGWFVPGYVVAGNPELGTWEGYQDAETARMFATAETGTRGRFLGTDPSWSQYDQQIIEALSLPFDVEYSGSEAATAAELARRIAAAEPVLLYWWSPSAEITRFDLVPVKLPERTPECEAAAAAGEPELCEYAEEAVLKLGAADLADRLPDLHLFLSRFALTTEEQLAMIDQVDNRSVSVQTAVEQWADLHKDRWETWLEP